MIELQGLSVRAGDFTLAGLDARIERGRYVVLMGATGSGKTTLLEALCGLKEVGSGKVFIDGVDVTTARPADRGIGYVPQDGALFSTMTVRDHLDFALRIRGRARAQCEERVRELANALELESMLDRMPHGLSGGERQRVAIGRALSASPRILCLDEPLSAVDEDARDGLCTLLRAVARESDLTVVHVTHSHHEAERLADEILTLENGALRATTR